jgi:hypothetical protein
LPWFSSQYILLSQLLGHPTFNRTTFLTPHNLLL